MSAARRGEAGVVMMFVLMAILLVGAVTLSVMQILTADVTGGVEQVEADQAFNIAQAGVHYAIGQLQLSGTAAKYTGGTLAVTNGSTPLGTATFTVNCADTTPSNNWTPPCPNSAYPGYRRIISTSTLPVSGPSRTIVAVVKGTSLTNGNGLCSLGTFTTLHSTVESSDPGDDVALHSNVGANGAVSMSYPPEGQTDVDQDTASPPNYTGQVSSNSTISCTARCKAAGGTFPSQSGTVCSAPPLPAFASSSGASALNVTNGSTQTIGSSTGTSCTQTAPCVYADVTVDNSSAGSVCPPYTTLVIQTHATDPTNIVYIQMNSLSLTYGSCARLVIAGVGKVDLRLAASTGTSLDVEKTSQFGVDSTGVQVSAGRLTVWVNSNGAPPNAGCQDLSICNVRFDHMKGAGTIVAPNGPCQFDDNSATDYGGPFYGSAICNGMVFTGMNDFYSDTSGQGGVFYQNFNTLQSWKDQ